MSFLQIVSDHRLEHLPGFVPVYAMRTHIGWTKRDFASLIASFGSVWVFSDNQLRLETTYAGFSETSKVVHDHFLDMSARGYLPVKPDYVALGWQEDWYDIETPPLLSVHRFYSAYLGLLNHAVIVHGYQDEHYWVALRSHDLEEGKGEYDHIVAGSVLHGDTVEETVLEEGQSECGLESMHLPLLKPVSNIHVRYCNSDGFLKNEMFHFYDLDTKGRFTPKVINSKEVQRFYCMPVQDLMELAEQTSQVKKQTRFALVDFFLRHGYLTQDHPDYDQIVHHMTKDIPAI